MREVDTVGAELTVFVSLRTPSRSRVVRAHFDEFPSVSVGIQQQYVYLNDMRSSHNHGQENLDVKLSRE